MRLAIFGDQAKLGLVVGERILDLPMAADFSRDLVSAGHSFASLLDLIAAGARGLDLVRRLGERFEKSDDPNLLHEVASVRLHAPFPGQRLAMAGTNFAMHVANAQNNFGKPITAEEVYARSRKSDAGGFWIVSPPVGTGSDIPMPTTAAGLFDYEGELGIILGAGGKRLRADDWEKRIWGRTLVIDWSIRNEDIFSNRRPFYGHKIFDASKSMGPWIVVDDGDPMDCDIETWLNGEIRQSFNSRDMIYSFSEILEQMSRDMTLLPGDVLTSGTGPGTIADTLVPNPDGSLPREKFLKIGDFVEVKSPTIGALTARVAPGDCPA